MGKNKSGCPSNEWELLVISSEVEPGDTLETQDEEGRILRCLWMGDSDRYSVFVQGEDGQRYRFYKASLEDKSGRMITGLSKSSVRISESLGVGV